MVLAFDNYAHVPASKAMTQSNRKKRVPKIDFSETQTLPCMVPEGERWSSCISNRTFKAKVIELVMCRLPEMVLPRYPGKQLIIDYQVCAHHVSCSCLFCVLCVSRLTPLS